MLRVVMIKSKDLRAAGYTGIKGGAIHGVHYAIKDTERGYCSADEGRTVLVLPGLHGKRILEGMIENNALSSYDFRETL
ncbi:MAG: hypothetical protein J6Y20_07445 [Lachnospiraceae bacterium]|nr:hypothetical protein [Lachnospiraceae bacterium]